ncbi:hypothetical protein [Pedobacter nutrimenti]|uniref:hypothetical protein n=1 Tax=Pedobacter nutrimenti TaxID=1241337 RepID=UPI00292D9BDC|nr:hypothetical protein [Pedobacter nutrimenti]
MNNLNYSFLDASIKYKLNVSKIDLELQATNIGNVSAYQEIVISDLTKQISNYTLPGRQILFKINFIL